MFKTHVTISGLAALAACSLTFAQQTPIKVDIEAQSLDKALNVWAQQTGYQVLIPVERAARGRTASGVKGMYTPEGALKILLASTDLNYQFVTPRTVAIGATTRSEEPNFTATDPNGEGTRAKEGKSNSSSGFRAAQVDQGAPASSPSVGKNPGRDSDQNTAKLEEVIVTAQKREERLIDVPISIVALSADALEDRKLTSLNDLQFAVPGMIITSDGISNRVQLRGVSNVQGIASLVGVYLDEADVTGSGSSQINADTYDLERVEVLRGPQGTLYGEGSAGGTIRFITKNPVLDRFGMTANVSSLFTQDGSPGERIKTAVNIPLIDNELGVRVAGTYGREGGWIDQPAAGLKDINGQDLTNVRVKSLWRPSPQFSATFMAELYRDDRSSGTYEDKNGDFAQVFRLTTTPKVSEGHDIYNLTLAYEFPLVKILSATSYLHERFDAKDLGYSTALGPSGGPPIYDEVSTQQLINDHAWLEELRLSSTGAGPWQWTVGGLTRNYRSVYHLPLDYEGYLHAPGKPLPVPYGPFLNDTLFKAWSIFGDINYKLWERLTFGLGVRSFHETQDRFQAADYGGGSKAQNQTGRFHSVDPRVYAQYQLSRDINIYTSAAKGFRSGGFNTSPFRPTFGPEDVRTYELGTKMSLLEGRLSAETAVFYTDYKDFIVVGFGTPGETFPASVNAGDAWIKGVDWDFTWRPLEQWSLSINGEYLNTRFTKINATSTAYQVGDPLDFVPKYQITSSAERNFSWNGKQLSMRLDYTRRGRTTYRNRSLGPSFYGESDVINLLGYYANLRWSESLSLNLFAQNLLNDRGLLIPSNSTPTRSRPRTYGVGFEVSF